MLGERAIEECAHRPATALAVDRDYAVQIAAAKGATLVHLCAAAIAWLQDHAAAAAGRVDRPTMWGS